MLMFYFNLSFGAYFLAAVFYAAVLFFVNKALLNLARFFMASGIIGLSFYIGMRWLAAGRPPLSNLFESLVIFSWVIALALILLDLKYKIKSITALAALLNLLAFGYASLLNKEITPLLPALKSNWLTIHVLTCFIGYAGLTIAFVSSLIFLFKKGKENRR